MSRRRDDLVGQHQVGDRVEDEHRRPKASPQRLPRGRQRRFAAGDVVGHRGHRNRLSAGTEYPRLGDVAPISVGPWQARPHCHDYAVLGTPDACRYARDRQHERPVGPARGERSDRASPDQSGHVARGVDEDPAAPPSLPRKPRLHLTKRSEPGSDEVAPAPSVTCRRDPGCARRVAVLEPFDCLVDRQSQNQVRGEPDRQDDRDRLDEQERPGVDRAGRMLPRSFDQYKEQRDGRERNHQRPELRQLRDDPHRPGHSPSHRAVFPAIWKMAAARAEPRRVRTSSGEGHSVAA